MLFKARKIKISVNFVSLCRASLPLYCSFLTSVFFSFCVFFFVSTASDIVTENQKNTTVTDQNTISLSLSDESEGTTFIDSADNSNQVGIQI